MNDQIFDAMVWLAQLAARMPADYPLRHNVLEVIAMANRYAFLRNVPVYDTGLAVTEWPSENRAGAMLVGPELDRRVTAAIEEYSLNCMADGMTESEIGVMVRAWVERAKRHD